MMFLFNFFVSMYFGVGQQWYFWIYIDDLCQIFVKGVEDVLFIGIYNGVVLNFVCNKIFVKVLIEVSDKNVLLLLVLVFVFQLVLGEMLYMVLDSVKVLVDKLLSNGFDFEYFELVFVL